MTPQRHLPLLWRRAFLLHHPRRRTVESSSRSMPLGRPPRAPLDAQQWARTGHHGSRDPAHGAKRAHSDPLGRSRRTVPRATVPSPTSPHSAPRKSARRSHYRIESFNSNTAPSVAAGEMSVLWPTLAYYPSSMTGDALTVEEVEIANTRQPGSRFDIDRLLFHMAIYDYARLTMGEQALFNGSRADAQAAMLICSQSRTDDAPFRRLLLGRDHRR
jgi:hypothetical protein